MTYFKQGNIQKSTKSNVYDQKNRCSKQSIDCFIAINRHALIIDLFPYNIKQWFSGIIDPI